MASQSQPDLTAMLAAWRDGDPRSLDHLMAVVYPELRRIARRQLAKGVGAGSFESAALANEAYLKLVRAGGIACENRVHFLALCAQIMRRILVDHVRERASAKRGGQAVRLAIDDIPVEAPGHGVEVLALEEALQALAGFDRRKSRVVELRYFGGLTIEETAEALDISVDIVKRDWRIARAWLLRELAPKPA